MMVAEKLCAEKSEMFKRPDKCRNTTAKISGSRPKIRPVEGLAVDVASNPLIEADLTRSRLDFCLQRGVVTYSVEGPKSGQQTHAPAVRLRAS